MRIGKFLQDNLTLFHSPTFSPTTDESQVTREPGYTSARECLRPDSTVDSSEGGYDCLDLEVLG